MADDDRYRWLDDEAAERLLRGQVVDARSTQRSGRHAVDHNNVEGAPTSDYGRPTPPAPSWARLRDSVPEQRGGEERLDSFLGALVEEQTATLHALGLARTGRVPAEAGGELPGEAAAVEAFRAANPLTSPAHSGTVDISAGPTEAETVVGRRAAREDRRRSRNRRSGAARRTSLMGRPLRAGFAMAVAGCALGGAAVAAGTGVLPTPFGGGGSPAASVSPLASPDDETEVSAGSGGSPYDGNSPRRGTREGDPSDSPSGEDLAGKERGRDGKGKGHADDEDWWNGNGKGLSDSDKKAMARALCNAYEDGKLSRHDRLRLETVAGPEGVKKWCDRHDGGRDDSSAGGSAGAGAPGGPGGPGGGPGGDDGHDGGGDDGGGESDGGGYNGGESGGGESDGGSDGGSRPDDSGGTDGTDGQSGETDGAASPQPESSPSAEETAPADAQ